MKQELIKLSSENGFSSQVIGKSVNSKYSSKTELFYLLWMTEVQKWLREEHKLFIEVGFIESATNDWISSVYARDCMSPIFKAFESNEHQTYEQALEEGIYQSLLLVKRGIKTN